MSFLAKSKLNKNIFHIIVTDREKGPENALSALGVIQLTATVSSRDLAKVAENDVTHLDGKRCSSAVRRRRRTNDIPPHSP
jgi:hypothetical protein